MKRLITAVCIMLIVAASAVAQTMLEKPNFSVPSLISTKFFGPNAFPVPDMSDGTTSDRVKFELYGDGYLCSLTSRPTDDITADLFARATIPLFTHRVNLVIWMPIFEWHRTTAAVNTIRRIKDPDRTITGFDSGDVYVSTDILLFDEKKNGVGVVLRAALKTASGNSFSTARFYDDPGYFFDVAAGRELFSVSRGKNKTALRMAASVGFLCWQTDNGRQDDAVMYGLLAKLTSGPFTAQVDYGGYIGWEDDGDRPMTLKTKLGWSFKDFSLNAEYQAGFKDWPFHQFRLGVTYTLPKMFLKNKSQEK